MRRVWGTEEVHTGFGGEPEGKSLVGRPRIRWQGNIKMIFKT